ncbi:MAG: polysaccharide biosynthesis/export family protein [Pirellulaceae bacterium]
MSLPVTICWVLLLVADVGCHRRVTYQARKLPPELVASRSSSLKDVDLSRLARSVGNSEILYPGDVVEITIATGADLGTPLRGKVRVDENGCVIMPPVGAVQVAGLEFNQAEQLIRAESIRRGQFVDPNVSLILASRRSHRVTVVGAVEKPGTYELPAFGSDVLAAIVSAEGLCEDAGTIVEVRHPPSTSSEEVAGQMPSSGAGANGRPALVSHVASTSHVGTAHTQRIDLAQPDVLNAPNLSLEDGATVMIRKRPTRFIHVIGLVRNADQFEMRDDQELRLLDAIALAGGCSIGVADKIHVVRQVSDGTDPVLIETSIKEAKRDGAANILLAAGDVVSVEETPVTLVVGTVRDFIRFGFTAGIPGL